MKITGKRFVILLSLTLAIASLTGCGKGWQRTDSGFDVSGAPLTCPEGIKEGEQCVAVAKTPWDPGGSEKISVVYTAVKGGGNCTFTRKDKYGNVVLGDDNKPVITVAKCGTKIEAIRSEKDRLATISGYLISGATEIGGKFIDRDARIQAAERDNSGDTWIIAPTSNAVAGSSSHPFVYSPSSAGANQYTGVGVSNQQSGVASCPSGKCQ